MSNYISLARYYDSLTEDVDYCTFADYYEKIFQKYDVKPELILDVACGTGTLTTILAGRGYEMIGTDVSEEMLAVAVDKAKASKIAPEPVYICQAMDELDLYGTVSAAICSLDGINYVDNEVIDELFRRLHLFIEPGGVFIFDINSPSKLYGLDGEMFIDETDDVYCVWRAEFDEEENACCYGMDIFARAEDKWERYFEEHIEYVHEPEKLVEKLKKAGFGEISVFGEFSFDQPSEDEERIFITARRM